MRLLGEIGQDQRPPHLIGFRGEDVRVLPYSDISRLYTKGRHVLADTSTGPWRVKQRIGELADSLPAPPFVQISQSEIVSIDFIDRLDLSPSASIGVRLTDGTRCFVSRRALPTFRRALGL
ncbi:MAG: LytTR family DNA-binding domain-containing protein [Actinomycetaceae bacterium]|nr:LytTR family DNA-binding domain-containing protein [Actinomycetaceae bacterium]